LTSKQPETMMTTTEPMSSGEFLGEMIREGNFIGSEALRERLLGSASKPKFSNMSDLHAWVVMPNGMILDYKKEALMKCSAFGTPELVYEPFEPKIQGRCMKHWKKKYKNNMINGRPMGLDTRRLMEETGYCMYRSLYMAGRSDKLKVVFGSLGFRQPDGSVFYEFG